MSKIEKISFKLKTIELLDVALNLPSEEMQQAVLFQFTINIETKLRIEDHYLILICEVLVHDQENNHVYGKIKTSCVFMIDNWVEVFNEKKKNLNMPDKVMLTFYSLAISTTRGVMFSQFRGTYLHNAILPILDPKSLIKNKEV
ncbi:MAG: hypothetical protein RIC80_03525 [Cyclobacteriaceae bacterium]